MEENKPVNEQEKYVNMMPDYGNMNMPHNEEFRVGFGKRFLALIVDTIILGILQGIYMFVSGSLSDLMALDWKSLLNNPAELQLVISNIMISVTLFTSIISLVYFSMEIIFGATLGKMMLSIKIAKADRTKASYNELAIRFLMKHSSTIITLIYSITAIAFISSIGSLVGFVVFISYFWIFSAAKQTLYDKIAKTAVYYNDEILENN